MKMEKDWVVFSFRNATPMECLEDTCYWVSTKIVEDAKKWIKWKRSAIEHNFQRVLKQLEKMDLLLND